MEALPATVPRTLEGALDPGWLTEALAPRFPGVQVTGVTPGPVINRVSTNARFRIICDGGVPDGLCPDLCAKGYFTESGWAFRMVAESEVRFYRELAQSVGVRTLRSVYAEFDPEVQHGVLLTEDVVAQGGEFLDALSEYSPDQVAESLGELATLHAATWGHPTLLKTPWLDPRLESYLIFRGIDEIRFNFEGPIGAGVPGSVRDPERLFKAYRRVATTSSTTPEWSVIHGDAHVGNLFLDGAGRPSLVDWQLVQRGPWYLDVGYHIASALTVDDRRRHEADLLRHYLEQLTSKGIDAPPWDSAREHSRLGIVHGLYLWGITLKVDPTVTKILLQRLGTAAEDHEVFAFAEGL
jgi:hypothetical protein